MKQEEVLDIFRETGALLEGHFILTSGFHSPHYFQCAKVLQYPEHLTAFSKAIADFFKGDKIDVVISPAIGGIVLGTEVGRIGMPWLRKSTLLYCKTSGILKIDSL